MTEARIQANILRWLETQTKVTLKTITLNKAGWPDIVCCISGVFVGIEVKDEGKEPTPLQYYKLKLIEDAGGVGIWADSLEMAQDKLSDHPRLN